MPAWLVNRDINSKVLDNKIHGGDDLVRTLKENDFFQSRFVKYQEAMKK